VSHRFTIDRALADPRLLGAALGPAETWQTWRTVLKASFGLELNREEARAFASVAGSRAPPAKRVRELWAIVGRRGGKSRIAAAVAVFIALFVKHQLARGERGMVLVIAGSLDQANTVFGYIRGFLEASPALQREVASVKRHEIELKNGIVIAVHSNSFRTVRGRTLVAAVFDEVAFWRDETSSQPDIETYRAVLPALATTRGMLVGISTPYRKLGLLHAKHRDHFGADDDDVLVVQGGSGLFNPSLSDQTIAAQRAADPTAAGSEWDAEFRADIGAYLDDALIEAAIEHARPLELPPAGRSVHYKAFTDASGCVGNDSYTLAIGHKENGEGGRFVIDVLRGTTGQRDPQQVTEEYAALLKEYGIREIVGDYYSAGWVTSASQKCGVRYVKSALAKSDIYLECAPLFTRGLIRLPDHPKLIRELRLLERHAHRSGRDTIDHGKTGHDDYANACCGVLRELSNYLGYDHRAWLERDADGNVIDDSRAWQQLRTWAYLNSGGRTILW
jgi:Phage Terminase